MTEEEVQQIYDYLHEHYQYSEGELIATRDISNKQKKGDKAGAFWNSRKSGHPQVIIALPKSLLGKKFQCSLAHMVYIYHFKIKPKFMAFKDANPANTRIENLIAEERRSKCYRIVNYQKKPKISIK